MLQLAKRGDWTLNITELVNPKLHVGICGEHGGDPSSVEFCHRIGLDYVSWSIAREADSVMYSWAGPEIAVATTKAYSAQLTALYLLAMKFARVRGTIDQEKFAGMLTDLRCLPDQIELLLGISVQ